MKTYDPTAKWPIFSDSFRQKQASYAPDFFLSLDTWCNAFHAFSHKTKKDEQEVKIEVSFEIYFKQVSGGPVAYPVEDYNYLFNGGKTVEVFAGVAITCCDHFFYHY